MYGEDVITRLIRAYNACARRDFRYISSMVIVISILIGVIFFPASILWLWLICTRPRPWARFTEAENAFWIRRGLPVEWAGACKRAEQGVSMKLVVAILILFSLLLLITPFALHEIRVH